MAFINKALIGAHQLPRRPAVKQKTSALVKALMAGRGQQMPRRLGGPSLGGMVRHPLPHNTQMITPPGGIQHMPRHNLPPDVFSGVSHQPMGPARPGDYHPGGLGIGNVPGYEIGGIGPAGLTDFSNGPDLMPGPMPAQHPAMVGALGGQLPGMGPRQIDPKIMALIQQMMQARQQPVQHNFSGLFQPS